MLIVTNSAPSDLSSRERGLPGSSVPSSLAGVRGADGNATLVSARFVGRTRTSGIPSLVLPSAPGKYAFLVCGAGSGTGSGVGGSRADSRRASDAEAGRPSVAFCRVRSSGWSSESESEELYDMVDAGECVRRPGNVDWVAKGDPRRVRGPGSWLVLGADEGIADLGAVGSERSDGDRDESLVVLIDDDRRGITGKSSSNVADVGREGRRGGTGGKSAVETTGDAYDSGEDTHGEEESIRGRAARGRRPACVCLWRPLRVGLGPGRVMQSCRPRRGSAGDWIGAWVTGSRLGLTVTRKLKLRRMEDEDGRTRPAVQLERRGSSAAGVSEYERDE